MGDTDSVMPEWAGFTEQLRRHLAEDDPANFLTWPIVLHTMFVRYAPFVVRELLYLRANDWSRWKRAIREHPFGRPPRYPLYPWSSGNLIHHAYSFARFEREAGVRVEDMGCIVEFGGGYGSMCRLASNLGFKGRYLIYDLPELGRLQSRYLTEVGARNWSCTSEWPAIEAKIDSKPTLLIATWSLSEAPVQLREQVLSTPFDFLLVAFQRQFGGVDNEMYFRAWAERRGLFGAIHPIKHLEGASYLIGQIPAALQGDGTGVTTAPRHA
jgi:hypothetical protein